MAKKGLKKLSISNASRFQVKETRPDYNKFKPTFSFHHINYRGNYCPSSSENASKAAFVNTIMLLSQRTWNELLLTQKESLGQESIPVEQFTIPLPQIVTPDVKKLMVFRFSDSERIAGIRVDNVYHVVAIGPDLYKH